MNLEKPAQGLVSCNPLLSPLCMVVDQMHDTLRRKMQVTYYQSAKDSGMRAEVIKRVEASPGKGSAETLLQLLEYYRKYFKSPFYHALISSYDIQTAGQPLFN